MVDRQATTNTCIHDKRSIYTCVKVLPTIYQLQMNVCITKWAEQENHRRQEIFCKAGTVYLHFLQIKYLSLLGIELTYVRSHYVIIHSKIKWSSSPCARHEVCACYSVHLAASSINQSIATKVTIVATIVVDSPPSHM